MNSFTQTRSPLWSCLCALAALFLLAPPGAAQDAATLDGLTLTDDQGNGVSLTPTFGSATTSYTATVPYSVKYVTVAATATAPDSPTYEKDDDGTRDGQQINLNRGTTTKTWVEARAAGKTTTRYNITVTSTPASTDAKLDGLSLSPGAGITPTFDEDTKRYTASVTNATTSITVTPTLPAGATVSFGDKIDSDTSTPNALDYALSIGKTTIRITVTAEDGRTKETYTIDVTRAVEQAKDVTLRSLTLSDNVALSPSFDLLTSSYTASVPNSLSSLTVTAEPTITGATATIGGEDATDGEEVALTAGQTTKITILVTATDGTTKGAYTIAVTRAGSSSTDATLRSLTPSSGTLSPAFDKETTDYTVGVANSVTPVTITAHPTVSGAAVAITPEDSDTGRSGHQVALTAGQTTNVTITVTATDGTTTKTYTIAVTRAPAPATDATLRSLTLSAGTLEPVFSPARETYTTEVYTEVRSITITARPNISGATATIGGEDATDGHQVALNEGANTIEVVVTATDGNATKTYTITVDRMSTASADPTLSALAVTATPSPSFSPSFNRYRYDYRVSVEHSVGFIAVTATASGGAEAEIAFSPSADADTNTDAHDVVLNAGQTTTVTITVTSPDGREERTYRIEATRAAAPSQDATLRSLTLSAAGTTVELNQDFNSHRTDYTASVAHDVSMLTVSPTVSASGATVAFSPSADADPNTDGHQVVAPSHGSSTTITVTVTASNGRKQTYRIRVTRAKVPAQDATLSSLTLTDDGGASVAFTPSFDPTIFSYAVSVGLAEETLTVVATPNAQGATATIDGEDATGSGREVTLDAGTTTITVTVTASNGRKQNYTLRVSRSASPPPPPVPPPVPPVVPSDATLGSLALTVLGTTESVALSPSFSPAQTSYSASVRNAIGVVTIAAQATDPLARVAITPADTDGDPADGHQVALGNLGANPVSVLVTAQNGATQQYTIIITRRASEEPDPTPSADATLSGLALSGGATLSPSFDSATTAYSATVASSVSSITVVAIPTVSSATATIGGADATSGHSVALQVGANTISVLVTAEDGTTRTYTLLITRGEPLSDEAMLSSLSLSAVHATDSVVLSPAFAPSTMVYTAQVGSATGVVTVTATAQDAGARVAITPTDSDAQTAGHQVRLSSYGGNPISIEITAQDGVTTRMYTLTVIRLEPQPVPPPSTDATLSALTLSAGTLSPAFAPDETSYTASVAPSVSSLTVRATPTASGATVAYTLGDVDLGSVRQVALSVGVGTTTIRVVVTAEDGTTQKTYTLTVTRAPLPAEDATLSALTLSVGTLSPAFVKDETQYTASVGHTVSSITVTPTPTVAQASAEIDGFDARAGYRVALQVGQNTITVTVTAADGTTKKQYTLTVTRAPPPANDATLRSLTLSAGTLSPAFAPDETSYTASVAHTVSSLTIRAETTASGATVAYSLADADANTAGHQLRLDAGENTIRVTVTAQDGVTQRTYTLTVIRLEPSTAATLSSLSLSAGTLSPAFAADRESYTASVAHAVSSLTIRAIPTASGATVAYTLADADTRTAGHQVALPVGTTTIRVVVTAQDGTTQKTYTLTLTRAGPQPPPRPPDPPYEPPPVPLLSTDATLRELALSDGAMLSPAFAAATTSYTARVDLTVETLTLTATAFHSGARVTTITPADADANTAGHQLRLDAGENTIRVTVTAQDGRTKREYAITITRAEPLSAEAMLSSLSLYPVHVTNPVMLSPAFAPSTMEYTARVGSATGLVTVTAIAQDAGARVRITPADTDARTAGHQVRLPSYGGNLISIEITAQDGTKRTYTLTVFRLETHREPPQPPPPREPDPLTPKSTDATLSALALSKGIVRPSFAATTSHYTAAVGHNVALVTILTVPAPGAKVTITPADADPQEPFHQVLLQVGENQILVLVTAEDATHTRRYVLNVRRGSIADETQTPTDEEADDEGEDLALDGVGELVFDGVGDELVLRMTGALKGPARGPDPQQLRGNKAQQATLGLAPAAHLDAGQQVELTLTAYQGQARAQTVGRTVFLEVTGGRGVTLGGTDVLDLGQGRAQLSAEGWLDGQRRVVLQDTVGIDTLAVTLVDADGRTLATLEKPIVYNPARRARFLVSGLPDTLVVGVDYWGTMAVVDHYGNVRRRDQGEGLMTANTDGIALPETIRWHNGRGHFWVRSQSFMGPGLALALRDVLDPALLGYTHALTARPLDAPDRVGGAADGLVLLAWDLSADHALVDSYRIFREQAADGRAPTVVEWVQIEADAGAVEGQAQLAVPDQVATRWGVAAQHSAPSQATSVEVILQGEQTAGLTVALFKQPGVILAQGRTNAVGRLALILGVGAQRPGGYFQAQASTAGGIVVGRWNSLPINNHRHHFVTLTLGGPAQVEEESLQDAQARKANLKDVLSAITWTDAAVGLGSPGAAKAHALHNYPNPFNPTTTIRYALAEAAPARLVIYNVVGQQIRTLVADDQDAGSYAVVWDATDERGQPVSAGIYFVHLQVGRKPAKIEKILLVK
ncbi:MAG: cadherin-like beta sandwich domain-containing protein [Gemmatimonadota bacterium]|nr:cadherin-like beta sandwich domain-containing protein [Gemmatimonadota bacterium]